MIYWTEPDNDGVTPVERSITEADAIAEIRKVAESRGHIYATDQEALEDFMAVHWAHQNAAHIDQTPDAG